MMMLVCVRRVHKAVSCVHGTIVHRYFTNSGRIKDLFKFSPEVGSALSNQRPVVALESTIITHGMPYPHNARTALQVEGVIRGNGAVPATVAILNGKVHIGLTEAEIDWLASGDTGAVKTSRRDLPVVLGQGLNGGTTVSGTMIAAHKAGIPIFVTGGIGGVHRGAESSLDISADLTELGRTPITVVSAGVKSILDIGRTLEYLETQGVCVASFGENKDFPAFFTPRSGFQAPYHVTSPKQAAEMIDAGLALGLGSGTLIAVPIPEKYAASGELVEGAIHTAVREAEQKGVQGKEVTPFILQRVNELTEGRSLEANIALILNNADIGSRIAVELANLHSAHPPAESSSSGSTNRNTTNISQAASEDTQTTKEAGKLVVVGGSIVDFTASVENGNFQMNGATYPGHVRQSYGGVGRNMADCLSRLACQPLFISAIGADTHAQGLLQYCQHMDTRGLRHLDNISTATYCAVLKSCGDLLFGIGDMVIHKQITPQHVMKFEAELSAAPLVFMDGNIPIETMQTVAEICGRHQVPLWFDPADHFKAGKPFQTSAWKHITYTAPNMKELRKMHVAVKGAREELVNDIVASGEADMVKEAVSLCKDLIQNIPIILVTLEEHGVLLCRNTHHSHPLPYKGCSTQPTGQMSAIHYPLITKAEQVVSVSGGGDCLASAVITGIIQGVSPDDCIRAGLLAAQMSLRSHHAVNPDISMETIAMEKSKLTQPWKPIHIL